MDSATIIKSSVTIIKKDINNILANKKPHFWIPEEKFLGADGIKSENPTLYDDNLKLLKFGSRSDFKILCEDKCFLVHKGILATRSSILDSMLDQPFKDKENNCMMIIRDFTHKNVECLLEFIYLDRILDPDYDASSLLTLAYKYEIPLLMEKCQTKLISELSVDNVPDILILSDILWLDRLMDEARFNYGAISLSSESRFNIKGIL